MKLITLLAVPSTAFAASWTSLFGSMQLEKGKSAVSAQDMDGCVEHVSKFITKPVIKLVAIERAMDHCALDKKIEDKNFVCPHFLEVLNDAFARAHSKALWDAKSFCQVTENYVNQMKGASNVPNMGTGSGLDFKISKDCKEIVLASIAPEKKLPRSSVPDFWYAMCMNQDCAHFLPSRTRWCTDNHAPTHSAMVCESVRDYARDEYTILGLSAGSVGADDVCETYAEFVEDTYIHVDAYEHVVHEKKHHKVPTPADKKRALKSAQMKNEASAHGIRDASGSPVESAAHMMAAGVLVPLMGLALL